MSNNISKNHFLAIIAVTTITICQPIFDIISQNPEFLAVRYLSAADIYFYVLAVGVLLPLFLGVLTIVTDKFLMVKVNAAFYFILSFLLFLLFFMMSKKLTFISELFGIVVSLFMAISMAYLYKRYSLCKEFFNVLSVSMVVLPVYFLFFTPIKGVVNSGNSYFEQENYQYGGVNNPKNVVMIVLDELSLIALLNKQEYIDKKNFKNIAQFLKTATWYKNATTVSNSTIRAVPSILTGFYPARFENQDTSRRSVHDWLGLPIYIDHPDNIFTLLSNSHFFHIREGASSLCPYPLCTNEFNMDRGQHNSRILLSDTAYVYLHIVGFSFFKEHLPDVQMGWAGFDNSNINSDRKNIFHNFINSIEKKNNQPQFVFLHTILPHMPWIYSESGEINGYKDVPGWSPKKWTNDKKVLAESYNLYHQQIKYVDILLGELFNRLKELDMYKDSLIIITADHGVTVQPDINCRAIESTSVIDVMSVPLFIHYPGQTEPKIDERYASVVDIVPTISDVLKIEKSWKYDGLSLIKNQFRDGRSLKIYTLDEASGENKFLKIDYKSLSWDKYIQRKYEYLYK